LTPESTFDGKTSNTNGKTDHAKLNLAFSRSTTIKKHGVNKYILINRPFFQISNISNLKPKSTEYDNTNDMRQRKAAKAHIGEAGT